MPTTPGPSASAKILITEKTPLMIPKERPETGGKEGLINVTDLYNLITSDPAPFPVAIPPHLFSPPDHLSLEVKYEGKAAAT